jgi:hypothetical protein
VRLQFVPVEELLNNRCGHEVRNDHSYFELASHFRMSELVVLLDASTGKIGSVLWIRAGLAPTRPIFAVFRGGGRHPLLSPKRETEATG